MPIAITDKARLRAHLRRDPGLHLYELGDLDDFFWPRTRWLALDDALDAVILLYDAPGIPVLVALGEPGPLRALLAAARDELPTPLYAHLSPGLIDVLAPRFAHEPRGDYLRMRLATAPPPGDAPAIVRLGPGDRTELEAFYRASYPGNWFDPRMIETGHHVAVRDGALVAVAGVHVVSPAERVAALGNIAVAPDHRGQGLGTRVTAAACRSLRSAGIDLIGLNVRADNRPAIACYERLGFVAVAPFEEQLLRAD